MNAYHVKGTLLAQRLSALVLGIVVFASPFSALADEAASTPNFVLPALDAAPLDPSEVTSASEETRSSGGGSVTSDTDDEDLLDPIDTSKDNDILKNFEGVIRQSTEYNCGAAALATLFTQLGYTATELMVNNISPSDPEKGISLLALEEAGAHIGEDQGVTVVLKKWTLAQVKDYVTTSETPVLVHDTKKGAGGHYSVIRSFGENTVEISDTEAGNITVSESDFAQVFDGYVLIATESPSDIPSYEGDIVTDEEAKTVWGKYVPVYVAIEQVVPKSVLAITDFKNCILKALTDNQMNSTARNAARAVCYTKLANSLAASLTGGDDALVLNKIDQSQKDIDLEDLSIGSPILRLKSELASYVAQLSALPTTISPTAQPLVDKRTILYANIATTNNAIASKQNLVKKADGDLEGISSSLGTIQQTIDAKRSSINSLNKLIANRSDYQANVTAYQKQVKAYTAEVASWQATVNYAQDSVNWFTSEIARKKKAKQNYTSEQKNLDAWNSNLKSAKSTLSNKQSLLRNAQDSLSWFQNQLNQANAAPALSASEQKAFNNAQIQLQNKQAELERVAKDRKVLVSDIADLNSKVSSYQSQINSLDLQINVANAAFRTSETLRLNAIIVVRQGEIKSEQDFIDIQEIKLQNVVGVDLVTESVKTAITAQSPTAAQQDEFLEGASDTFFAEYGIELVSFGSGIGLAAGTELITKEVAKKVGKTGAGAVVMKFVPGVGWILTGATVAYIGSVNADAIYRCTNSNLYKDETIQQNRSSYYYCGKLATRSAFIAGGYFSTIKLPADKLAKFVSEKIKLTPLNLGSSVKVGESYLIARNIEEKLAMEEVLANPRLLGQKTSLPALTDTRWLGWYKYDYTKSLSGGKKVKIHFNAKLDKYGNIIAVDDFKFLY